MRNRISLEWPSFPLSLSLSFPLSSTPPQRYTHTENETTFQSLPAIFCTFGLLCRSYYYSTGEAIKVISEVINISDNEEVLKCRLLNKLIFNLIAVLLSACIHFV